MLLGLGLAAAAQPPQREFVFHTVPPGARVFLEGSGNRGGDYLGLSDRPVAVPLTRLAGVGTLDFRFEAQGYRPEVRTVRVSEREFSVRLEPLTRPFPAGSVGLALLGLAALAVWGRGGRPDPELERRLATQREELERRDRELSGARQSGRQEVAHDLHDGLLQAVAAAGTQLAVYRERYHDSPELELAQAELEQAWREGRRLLTPAPDPDESSQSRPGCDPTPPTCE